LEGILKEEE